MISKKKEAGDLIDFMCTRCKLQKRHTIVAMVEGKIVRVKCNACGGEHNYRAPEQAKAPRRAATAGVRKYSVAGLKKVSTASCEEQWRAAVARHNGTTPVAYKMDGKYNKDMLIAHPTYGLGVVTKLSYSKMEVFFNNGPTWLCCQ